MADHDASHDRRVHRGPAEPQPGPETSHRPVYYLDRDQWGWRYEVRQHSDIVKRGWRPSRRWAKQAARRSMKRRR